MDTLPDFCKLGGVRAQSQHSVENLYLIPLFLIVYCFFFFFPLFSLPLWFVSFIFVKFNVIFVGFQKGVKADA